MRSFVENLVLILCLVLSFSARAEQKISPEQLQSDLLQFVSHVQTHFAYSFFDQPNYQNDLQKLKSKIQKPMTKFELAVELQKLLAIFPDSHAQISGYEKPKGNLPFLIDASQNGFVVYTENRESFWDNNFPFLQSLDGWSIEEWQKRLEPFLPRGSAAYRQYETLRWLRSLNFVRALLDLQQKPYADLVLLDSKQNQRKAVRFDLTEKFPFYGEWPKRSSQVLPKNIGYWRIADMDEEAARQVDAQMQKFKGTQALILDVRGNRGGQRDVLVNIFQYFVNKPRVVNVAFPRKFFSSEHLNSRYLYSFSSGVWNEEEKKVLKDFQKTFAPQYEFPKDEFGAAHFLVLGRKTKNTFFYDKPIVVLMDQKCFSATDVFLSALKGLKNVTLVGQASSGGSSAVQKLRLEHSKLRVKMGSMLSFQIDGSLFDGNGVKPDVEVFPKMNFVLKNGDDVILEKAVEMVLLQQSEK